jgi:carboxylate-amine ligase
MLPTRYVEENKWRAARYGLDADYVDFVQSRRMPMRDAIGEVLDFVDDVLDDLDSRREINYLRRLLEDPRGTGSDRQRVVYQETGSTEAVTRFLMTQTMQAISLNAVR